MVMFARRERGRFSAQIARHAEMQPEPALPGKAEEHLFAMRFRAAERCAGQGRPERREVEAAKNPFVTVQFDAKDFLTHAGVPPPAMMFHFGEFRHGRNIADAYRCPAADA